MPTQLFHWLGGSSRCRGDDGVQVMFGMAFAALAGRGTSSAEETVDPATSKQHDAMAGIQSVLTFARIAKAPDQWRTAHGSQAGFLAEEQSEQLARAQHSVGLQKGEKGDEGYDYHDCSREDLVAARADKGVRDVFQILMM